ncbi:MAG: ATP-binding protein, partial [Pseudohongiella sp.]
QILKAGWYLLDLINEILDLALVESGKMSLSIESVSLANVLQECQEMTESQAKQQGVKVSFPGRNIPKYIQADYTRIKQILINLLSNAIKYNGRDGLVVVGCSESASGRIRISVEDTGEGLSDSQIAQLFQPFNRLGKELSAVEGTGIGLVMAKRLIELMGGKIGVQSVVGKGSTFWVELDSGEAPRLLVAADVASAKPPEEAALQQYTMLYVEDNPANQILVEDLVARRPDIRLLSAVDGISGVEMALSAKPDIILMDINLPGINGFRVLEILATDARTATIPVVAMSANAMPRDIEKGLAAGFFRYLTKPIRVNEFMDTLDITIKLVEAKDARNL